jgi:two-component system phosphate regulon sensor histidine kinase PhoR
VSTFWWILLPAGAVGLALLVMLAIVYRSLRELRRAADRLAQGDFNQRIGVKGPLQLRGLAERLNQMAGQLQSRLATVVQQRNELGAVLSSMSEGVVAIDTDEQIISLNRAAAELLSLSPTWAIGRPIQEALRNSALQQFIARSLKQNAALQEEITLRPTTDQQHNQRHMQAQSAILRDARGRRFGAVIVLHDVTRIRRLELVRREFVANVSHEIKTPVSAIRAAVETLEDEDMHDPEQTKRILGIVGRQSQRLGQIVDDLLSLARIEQQEQGLGQELQVEPVAPVLRAAVETCQSKAEQTATAVAVDCPSDLRAPMNRALLEQALVNLIDNAIKYSDQQTTVHVLGRAEEDEVVLAVKDQGRGIEPEHLPRVFERFYRTDKARSRAMGGTGLGLSIVKHVAEAQGGRVSVDSTPGGGSEFRIHLSAAGKPSPQPDGQAGEDAGDTVAGRPAPGGEADTDA